MIALLPPGVDPFTVFVLFVILSLVFIMTVQVFLYIDVKRALLSYAHTRTHKRERGGA